MRPSSFFPSLPNQIQPQSGSNPAFQQVSQFNPHQFPPSSFAHQQNPTSLNHPQSQAPPLPHGQNPRFPTPPMPNFNGQNTHFNNFSGIHAGAPNCPTPMPPPCGAPPVNQLGILPPYAQLGLQQPAQNMNQVIAALQLLQQQQNMLQNHGQHNYLGQLQNNVLAAALLQPGGLFASNNMPPNINQLAALQMGHMCLQNPMLNGNQMLPFQCPPQQHAASSMQSPNIPPSAQPGGVGNPQLVPTNSNSNFGNMALSNEATQCSNQDPRLVGAPTTMCQSAIQEAPAAAQKSQPLVRPSTVQTQTLMNMQLNRQWRPQINPVAGAGNHISSAISDNSTRKNLTRNFHQHGTGVSSDIGFQKYQFPHVKNAKGNMGPFIKNGGKGQQKRRERNWLTKSNDETQPESRRPVPFKYTETEILTWREARKKNFPTRANIQKKLTMRRKLARKGRRYQIDDEDAKLRRQELKEVLAKQAELGIEVAEIPPRYLAEPKKWIDKRGGQYLNKRGGQYQNKHEGGEHDREKRHPKRSKISATPAINAKREPTLLQKLLSSDIRRDKSRLLQVFRFMVLNSFFEQSPDKPLVFPVVKLEDMGRESVTLAAAKDVVSEETSKDDVDRDDEGAGAGSGSDKDDSNGEDEQVAELLDDKEDNVGDKSAKWEGEISE